MNVTNSIHELQQQQHQQQHLITNSANIENEESVVTSTSSNDLSYSASPYIQQQQEQQQPNIDSTIASPARITSSTGNDCSISPPLRPQQQHQLQALLPTSEREQEQEQSQLQQTSAREKKTKLIPEDNSRSHHGFVSSVLPQQPKQQQKQQQRQEQVADIALMPNKSAESSTTPINNLRPNQSVLVFNSAPSVDNNMVSRNISAPPIPDSERCGNVDSVSGSTMDTGPVANQKIILKLPRPSAVATVTNMTHKIDVDPTSSNSSSYSSSTPPSEDTRKVEPLKINLHGTHANAPQQHNVPKITIKPIIKNQSEETDASCSSSADDDPPIPKLTIKTTTSSINQHNTNTVGAASEPHIVPKLTIRSGSGEEGSGALHSASVLPRLTIKMSDAQSISASAAHNNLLLGNSCSNSSSNAAGSLMKSPASMTSSACSTPSPPSQNLSEQIPPLPKLTIKTSLDGTSNSIISSHISSASLSSSSSTSSSSSISITSCTSYPHHSTLSLIPKLTIKSIPKPEELVVPKLTIKTNAAGNSACAASIMNTNAVITAAETPEDSVSSKIPKLTIKTGQDAVIITQHSTTAHAQSVPKLTIKTKSLDLAESPVSSLNLSAHKDESPPEKIPKITIKTSEVLEKGIDVPMFCIKTTVSSSESFVQQQQQQLQQQQPTIPKLTITVTNPDCAGHAVGGDRGPQSPLIVRQISSGTSRKTAALATATSPSPERVPKLMISRQDSGCSNSLLVVSNHSGGGSDGLGDDNKIVPKLTIKTSNLSSSDTSSEAKETKSTKFSIKAIKTITEEEKIPKLTIKSVMPQQSSEESDECVSLSSCSSPVHSDERNTNSKTVPKLMIKNLSSPQPVVKTVSLTNDSSTTMPALKKCSTKNIALLKNDISATESIASIENVEKVENQPKATMSVVEQTIDEAFATSVVDAKMSLPTTNGGESNSSQEFCGFNDNTIDSNIESANLTSSNSHEEESRRHSDDMDIDETLQQEHAPQVFNNVAHFTKSGNVAVDEQIEAPSSMRSTLQSSSAVPITTSGYLVAPIKHPKLIHVIDTVDLTSSPSPGSSPAHLNYIETAPQEISHPKATDFLLEHLQKQREASVIQQATTTAKETTLTHNILFNKLTNQVIPPPNRFIAPPPQDASIEVVTQNTLMPVLQTKLENCLTSNSAKYPHLAERLSMANGLLRTHQMLNSATKTIMPPTDNVIVDSIEILDTPDGSPRSSLDDDSSRLPNPVHKMNHLDGSNPLWNHKDTANHNNNNSMIRLNHGNLKRQYVNVSTGTIKENHLEQQGNLQISPNKMRRIENDVNNTMAALTILANDHHETNTTALSTSPTMNQSSRRQNVNVLNEITKPSPTIIMPSQAQTPSVPTHRSRKQKHEHLLTMPPEEQDPLQLNCNDIAAVGVSYGGASGGYFECVSGQMSMTTAPRAELTAGANNVVTAKRRGRPRKCVSNTTPSASNKQQQQNFDTQRGKVVIDSSPLFTQKNDDKAYVRTRMSRVQVLRKRLAIDMVDTAKQSSLLVEKQESSDMGTLVNDSMKRDRILRTPLRPSRRSATPNTLIESNGKSKINNEVDCEMRKPHRKKQIAEISGQLLQSTQNQVDQQHFGGSNSNSCSTSSISSSTATATSVTMAAQIDLTMCSSSSSNGSHHTITTVEAGAVGSVNRPINCMLPPTTILSSSDPLADVVFRPNDFSSLVAAQQLRSPIKSRRLSAQNAADILLTPSSARSRKGSRTDSRDDEGDTLGSGIDNSGDESASSITPTVIRVGRGRGRGRGRSSGRGSAGIARGVGTRTPRIGRGASSVAKAIAMNRPRCVGGLKHTPDPERLKGLFSPAPQVFEEDTRMSADLNQMGQVSTETASVSASVSTGLVKQFDFLTNEESQSSALSNTSILDPNAVAAVQNGVQQQQKRPKKKKMEICVSEDTEFTVTSIAEYEWPPPKGCCPSKNRDTFMIQEQVALYLGIKSFKRKYPDLPRRQIDMEERNWLQEKGLVSEKMCDLGITAVWASDILDIMYTDFYDKYEEYKEFIRQKHVRNIEVKQKALGINVSGRGLQARDRALQSTSKWNTFFNKSRKEDRHTCMDLQTLTVNVPLPNNAPINLFANRSIMEAVTTAKEEGVSIPKMPTLPTVSLSPHTSLSYPLALLPGQYCENYRHYTPLELRSYPLNTILDDPLTISERLNNHDELAKVASDADTESATETAPSAGLRSSYGLISSSISKRIPIRRSRRARTNAMQQVSTIPSAESAGRISDNRNAVGTDEEERQVAGSNTVGVGGGEEKSQDLSASNSDSNSDSDISTSSSDIDSNSDSSSCSSSDNEIYAKCGVCQGPQNRNLKNLPEVFLKCYTCRRKVHPSCIEMPYRMTLRARNYNWQCADCKCCIKCKRRQDQNKMLFCEQCDRGFHIYCIEGKSVPEGRWSCDRCSFCMRCGATKPEGLPSAAITTTNLMGGQNLPGRSKQRKLKWVNEYRIDHITKLREHFTMLCVPCGRLKATNKRNNQYGGGGGTSGVMSTNAYSQMSPLAPGSVISTTMAL